MDACLGPEQIALVGCLQTLDSLQKSANIGTVGTDVQSKLKKLLDLHRPGTILLAAWLEDQGFSRDLQARYRRSGWLESVGTGAFKRPHETVTWQGALYSLQQLAGLHFHAGAMTALSLRGFSQYLRLGTEDVFLFSPRGVTLPAWFRNHDWGVSIKHVPTTFLPAGLGLEGHEEKTCAIRISGPERAMLECLYLAPKELDLLECYQVMEGLANLRPPFVQELLVACSSIKVKRLFLYLADKACHQWLPYLDQSTVDLGTGTRSLATGGVYVANYNLVVPQPLANL